jgi:hypothetical protein
MYSTFTTTICTPAIRMLGEYHTVSSSRWEGQHFQVTYMRRDQSVLLEC